MSARGATKSSPKKASMSKGAIEAAVCVVGFMYEVTRGHEVAQIKVTGRFYRAFIFCYKVYKFFFPPGGKWIS